ETQNAAIAAKIEVAASRVGDLDKQIAQIDGAIAEATKRGKTNAALSAMDSQRKARAVLAGDREKAAGLWQASRQNGPGGFPGPEDRDGGGAHRLRGRNARRWP